MVGNENWYMMEGDFKGAIYESILEKNGQDKKSSAGQYFTPRALIKAMVEVTDPKITETVYEMYMQSLIQGYEKLKGHLCRVCWLLRGKFYTGTARLLLYGERL